jgi:glycosyltransferase involved in cell wall biosynthesis
VLAALGRRAPAVAASVASRLEVVPNGLVLPPPPFRRGGQVLSVGRLIRDKGMDVLIDAMAGMRGPLTIAGDGPERAALEGRARRHGLEARFVGFVPRDALDRHYRESACVALASRRGEGMPNVLLEAMSYARPVVATAVTGVTDLVRDGQNGLLVPPGDVRALREALARLAGEPGLADRLAATARATAEDHAWDRIEPRLEALLERWRRR